jgi:hypothetical protein
MKKLAIVITLIVISSYAYCQAYKAYIRVTYSQIARSVSIVVGDSAIIPKDSKGQPQQFKTTVAVLNWLSKKGWHIEPIYLNTNDQMNHTYLMSRENTTDKELSTMFNK